jgi:hypothetical protein
MTTNVLAHRGRAALTATATVAALSLFTPVQATARAAVGAPITLEGGDATAKLVCGNVADAEAFAASQNLAIQRNACHPRATGGDVELHDVQIVIRAAAVHASEDNESLADLAVAGGAATAETTCTATAAAAAVARAVRNHCWSRARGGRLELRDVTFVSHQAGAETRKQVRSLFVRGTNGRVGTGCGQQTPAGHDARDDCRADGVGGSIDLRSVDVTAADGTTSSNVRVLVRGGNANASVYCFNYVNAATQTRQANTCSSTAQGGDATLRNVTIHVYR